MGLLLAGGYAVHWAVRLIRSRSRTYRVDRAFWVAPLIGVFMLLVVTTFNASTDAKWTASQAAFEHVVRDLQPLPPVDICPDDDDCYAGWGPSLDVPRSVGRYTVDRADRVEGGIVFRTGESCNWFDDAGIAWFPKPPNAELLATGDFERPEFTHLGGPWYRWCASW